MVNPATDGRVKAKRLQTAHHRHYMEKLRRERVQVAEFTALLQFPRAPVR